MGVSECAQAWHGMVSRVRCLDDDGRVPTVAHSPVLLVELEGLLYPRGGFVGLLLPRWGLAGGGPQPPVLEDRARLPIELLRNEVAQVRLHHGAPLNRTLTPPPPEAGSLRYADGALAPALSPPVRSPRLTIHPLSGFAKSRIFRIFLRVPANWHEWPKSPSASKSPAMEGSGIDPEGYQVSDLRVFAHPVPTTPL